MEQLAKPSGQITRSRWCGISETGKMVLELDDFRDDMGGCAEKIRKNQANRFKDVGLVDKVTFV